MGACGGARGGPIRRSEAGPEWVEILAGAGRAIVRGLAASPAGGAVAVGGFDGELAAGTIDLTSAGAGDGFALGLSPAGSVQWGVALSGSGDEELTAVAASRLGALAVAGTASGPARLGEAAVSAPAEPAAIVARLDPSGAPMWRRAIAATRYAVPTAVCWTADGDVIVAGYFSGTLDPDGAALHGAGSLDLFVARLAGADGGTMWIHRAGGPGADAAQAAAAIEDGAVVVAGSFQRWADFSATTLRSADDSADPFVAMVGRDGFAWARSVPAEGAGSAQSLAAAPGRRVAAAITYAGSLAPGDSRTRAGRGGGSGLVALFDSAGELVWARPVPDSSSADALVGAESGGFLVAGASAGQGAYLAALSAAGQELGSYTIGDSSGQAFPSALTATRGGALVGGSASGRLAIGPFSAAVQGESDGFIARLPVAP